MCTLKYLKALLPIFLLAPMVHADERLVWDENGVSKTPPNIVYSFKYGTGFTVELDTAEIDGKGAYYMGATISAKNESLKDAGAGFGFYWNATFDDDEELIPATTNLSKYNGVCLTYSSTNVIRMDFMQKGIKDVDDNFFGIMLPNTENAKLNKFVSYDDLKMGWKGKNDWTFKADKQLGLQFTYKSDHLKKYGLESSIMIYALRNADECPQHAPEVNPDIPTKYSLNEGESLVIKLADVFHDLDGDELTISGTWTGDGVTVDYDDTQERTLADSLTFKTVKNPPETPVKYTFTATDPTGRKASWVIEITPIDTKHVPTIRDTAFTIYQGESVNLPPKFSFYGDNPEDMSYLIYDLDGDEFELFLDEEDIPEVGEFAFDAQKGRFTYTAPEDYVGDVTFSLYAVEKRNPESISNTIQYVIHVLDINDPPVVKINDPTFKYYKSLESGESEAGAYNDPELFIEVNEDFEDTIWIEIDETSIVFTDEDDEELTMGVKTNGIVNARLVTITHTKYIEITAKKDLYGMAEITYYADDGEFQVGVTTYVKVIPVDDLPVANDDSYEAVQGTKLSVNVKNGLLNNDTNVDDPDAELRAKVVDKPKNGDLTLKEDGSFTYKSKDDFSGEDTFTYICINEVDGESEPAKVVINVTAKNAAPIIVEKVVDSLENVLSTLKEDVLTSGKVFKLADVKKWFIDPDDDPLTFDAINEDGKLKVEVTETSIKISPMPDSCGTSEIIISATDTEGATTEMVLAVKIQAVNDIPVAVKPEDARYVVELNDWNMEFDLDTLVTDVDSKVLTYEISKSSSRLAEFLKMEIDGNILKVSPQAKGLDPNTDYLLTIVASDEEYSVNLVITFHSEGQTKVNLIAAQTKVNWQNAVQTSRGIVSLMDMQGRVMWKTKLPVSETEVHKASAKVQGRKLLKVNSQTWTIQ